MSKHENPPADFIQAILENYVGIAGKCAIKAAGYNYGTPLQDDLTHQKCLLALVHPQDKSKILLLAYEDTARKIVGIKTDPLKDGKNNFMYELPLGRTDVAMTEPCKARLKTEMQRILKSV